MEQSPSWEANNSSASQEIPRIIWKPEGSLLHSQQPATCPYPEPYQSNPYPLTIQLLEEPFQYYLPIPRLHDVL
jgi:hypothetical protein